MAIALADCALPACRASPTDPIVALRTEYAPDADLNSIFSS
jgi:hypothetical protein